MCKLVKKLVFFYFYLLNKKIQYGKNTLFKYFTRPTNRRLSSNGQIKIDNLARRPAMQFTNENYL